MMDHNNSTTCEGTELSSSSHVINNNNNNNMDDDDHGKVPATVTTPKTFTSSSTAVAPLMIHQDVEYNNDRNNNNNNNNDNDDDDNENNEQRPLELQEESSNNNDTSGKPTPLSMSRLLCVVVLFISEGFAFTFMFPFVGFMIMDFGMVSDERDAGYYAGLLAGCYSVAQFFSGFIFGILSDRVSKKIVVMISTAASTFAILLFGTSKNFYYAIAFRALNGGLNGSVATAKAYLTEITDGSNQAQAFSFIGLSWGIGAIGGPAIGGFLSHPVEKYPSVFGNMKLFSKFPYLLPCMFTSAVMLFAFVFTSVFMAPPAANPDANQSVENSSVTGNDEEGGDVKSSTEMEVNDMTTDLSAIDTSGDQLEEFKEPVGSYVDQKSLLKRIIVRSKNEIVELFSLYRSLDVVVCSIMYFTFALVDTMQEELFPLWAMIDQKNGGIGFKTNQLGIVQICTGLVLISEPFLYPRLCKYVSKLNCTRLGLCVYASLVFTPLLNILAKKSMVWLGFGLATYCVWRSSTEMLGFTSIFILMNNSSPKGAAGRVQSLNHSAGSIARALAPFLAGPTLAYFARLAETKSKLFMHAPFFLLTIASGISFSFSFLLKQNINNPKN